MISIRPATPNDARAIGLTQIASWRSAYAHIMPAEYLAAFTDEEQQSDWLEILSGDPPPMVYVAQSDSGVVGFALGALESFGGYDGELSVLHIHPDYRNQGIGRVLFAAIADALKIKGCRSMYLWTLRENTGAQRFYERLGGVRFAEKTSEIGKTIPDPDGGAHDVVFNVTDFAYGWPDIESILTER